LPNATNTIADHRIARLNNTNVFGDQKSYPQPGREAVATRPADVFLILGNASSNSEAPRSGAAGTTDAQFLFTTFPNMPASRSQRVIVLPDLAAEPGSWRNADFVTALARYLHPNAFAGK
jgi:ABC-type Fe3+-hydroxamate transport system substrate-binding protein